jgi:hypothetical protein
LLPLFENGLFEIVFDVYTPRPHFIIKLIRDRRPDDTKPKNKPKIYIDSLVDSELHELIKLVQEFAQKFDLTKQKLILSFHIGYWVF